MMAELPEVDWSACPRVVDHPAASVLLVPRGSRLSYGRVLHACSGFCGTEDCRTVLPVGSDTRHKCLSDPAAPISRHRAERVAKVLGRQHDLRGRYLGWDLGAYTHSHGAYYGLPPRHLYLLSFSGGRFHLGVARASWGEVREVGLAIMRRLRRHPATYISHESHFDGLLADSPVARAYAARLGSLHKLGTASADLLARMLDEALVDLDMTMERSA